MTGSAQSSSHSKSRKRFSAAAATVTYVLGGCAAGLILGGLGGRLFGSSEGGDALADVLGGIGVGMMIGAVLTLGSARRLSAQRRARIGSAFLLLAALAFSVLRARAN